MLAEGAEDGGGESGGQVVGQTPDEPNGEQGEEPTGSQTPEDGTDSSNESEVTTPPSTDKPAGGEATTPPATEKPSDSKGGQAGGAKGDDEAIAVIGQPESLAALVNPLNRLPDEYVPSDLVYPEVRFIFKEKIEKRMMRKEAAEALENLFAGAEKDDIYLAGVSAYRSHKTQKALFERYVKRDGYEKARTYSALPGTSEHETGLAVDVTSSDGKCAAADCFGDTKEAAWLKKNAADYGFIIRYPEGKQDITGYQYEPWHLRYVGADIAVEIAADDSTLEEYYNAVPVSGAN
ncbi:D-alanyl-D-alanine carboxypeptidase family protein [Paenibacillus paeoniae]|uniref:D-alanyl-D-alanine carboxypeptidase family protein n=2 Tax=Paenibacillus paeoniae TaxID=2292705 RepID=A0A371P7Z3_9BACL|nr:D-alanyl-D-alanine carboxypeptidase family protein [Paenibacillus paeoniae]